MGWIRFPAGRNHFFRTRDSSSRFSALQAMSGCRSGFQPDRVGKLGFQTVSFAARRSERIVRLDPDLLWPKSSG